MCSADGRDATVEGTLTNESRIARDYTVFVTVDDEADVMTFVDLAAGETVEWTARIRTPP